MPRFIASICNDDNLTSTALMRVGETLRLPDAAAGYGVGWIHRGQSLLRTTPRPTANGAALIELLADVRTREVLGVLHEDADAAEPADMQPYRFRRWVFAHALVSSHAESWCPAWIRRAAKLRED